MENTKCKLLLGDCLDLMKDIDDNSVDMILCDLPYGITAPKWDSIIPIDSLWKEYDRILKKNCIVALTASQPFTTMLISSNIKNFKYVWYWIKNQGTNFFHAKKMPIRKIEEIVIFGGKKYYPQKTENHSPTKPSIGSSNGRTYHGKNKRNYIGGETTRFPTNILNFPCVNNYSRLHSSEKPVELLEYMIKTYTVERETVLDNCMGSGSTGVACSNTNRYFIGIEKDKEYFYIAKNRIENHFKQKHF